MEAPFAGHAVTAALDHGDQREGSHNGTVCAASGLKTDRSDWIWLIEITFLTRRAPCTRDYLIGVAAGDTNTSL